jgi:hypothetical protein
MKRYKLINELATWNVQLQLVKALHNMDLPKATLSTHSTRMYTQVM